MVVRWRGDIFLDGFILFYIFLFIGLRVVVGIWVVWVADIVVVIVRVVLVLVDFY